MVLSTINDGTINFVNQQWIPVFFRIKKSAPKGRIFSRALIFGNLGYFFFNELRSIFKNLICQFV